MTDFARHMEAVARALLGEPNKRFNNSKELRFGSNGSLKVEPEKGRWYSHEEQRGGGVLALIGWKTGLKNGAAIDWMRQNGIQLDEDRPKAKRQKQARGRVVATFDYVDEHGEVLSQTVRFEPKDFKQRRPNGKGGWIWGLGDRRVLYRLPELLDADPAELVFVPEGEKHVDRLRSLGLVATTSPEGAEKWVKVDPAVRAVLTGRPIVILADNDDRGRKHAAQIVRDLHGKAASIRVLELAGLAEKGDVINWLDAGGTVEELRRLAAEAPEAQPEPEAPADWQDELIRGKDGPRPIEANVAHLLRHDPALRGRVRLNRMSSAPECRDMPWVDPEVRTGQWRQWTDADDCHLAEYAQRRELRVRPQLCATAITIVATEHAVHPVREWLDGLHWDGTPRLSEWLITYCRADLGSMAGPERARRRRYLTAVGRKWPISAVARAYEPGCQADYMLVLEGRQGPGKSSALRVLAGRDEWFCDQIAALDSKDSAQDLRGKWIVELSELAAVKGREVARVKAFVSRRFDHYRASYNRYPADYPRHCVLAGTINEAAYLADDTGGRRFWPVKVGAIDLDALRHDREQLWAEAVAAYKAGELGRLDEDLEAIAGDEQEERRIVDPWHEVVAERLRQAVRAGRDWVTVKELLTDENCLSKHISMVDRRDEMRVGAILRQEGWTKAQRRIVEGGPQRRIYECPHLKGDPDGGRDGGRDGPKANNHAASSEGVPTVPTVPTFSLNKTTGETGNDGHRGSSRSGDRISKGNGGDGGDGGDGAGKPLNGKGNERPYLGREGRDGPPAKVGTAPHCRHCGELVDDRDPRVMTFADGSLGHLACDDAEVMRQRHAAVIRRGLPRSCP